MNLPICAPSEHIWAAGSRSLEWVFLRNHSLDKEPAMNIELNQLVQTMTKQNELLERIATSSHRTNELLYAMLSEDQKKRVDAASVAALAKSLGKPARP